MHPKSLISILALSIVTFQANAAGVAIGAAPQGDAKAVASRIIKYNFPSCKRVSNASRAPDGSIRANCDGNLYMVFTMFNAREGKLTELAMNCTAAKALLDISC